VTSASPTAESRSPLRCGGLRRMRLVWPRNWPRKFDPPRRGERQRQMTHFNRFFDKEYLGHWDLPEDKDAIAIIAKVEAGELHNPGKKADKKPIITFEGKDKRMVVNATNAKTIAAMYGPHVEEWIGKP